MTSNKHNIKVKKVFMLLVSMFFTI